MIFDNMMVNLMHHFMTWGAEIIGQRFFSSVSVMVFLEEFNIHIAESIKQIALPTSGGPNLTH